MFLSQSSQNRGRIMISILEKKICESRFIQNHAYLIQCNQSDSRMIDS